MWCHREWRCLWWHIKVKNRFFSRHDSRLFWCQLPVLPSFEHRGAAPEQHPALSMMALGIDCYMRAIQRLASIINASSVATKGDEHNIMIHTDNRIVTAWILAGDPVVPSPNNSHPRVWKYQKENTVTIILSKAGSRCNVSKSAAGVTYHTWSFNYLYVHISCAFLRVDASVIQVE
jgi:hypothetical protein